MATTKETVLARIIIDDDTKVGFQSYARNAERAKKTTEAFRTQAVDKLVESLDKQVLALGKSARQLDIAKAATLGATAAEQALVSKLHDDINAHNQAEAAASRLNKEREQAAAATDRVAAAVHRSEQAYLQERATVGMTADELEIYRLKMMGANQAQLESVMSTQQATKAFRQQGSAAAGTAKGGLRLMRGGMGQLGHQVQDVAVQLQMGQNALLIFGQQGSQVASLFGQNGALIGAVLAVGAALGTYLAPKVFKTTDALKEFKKSAEAVGKYIKIDFINSTSLLTDKLDELIDRGEALAVSTLRIEYVNALRIAGQANAEFTESLRDLFPLKDITRGTQSFEENLALAAETLNIMPEKVDLLRAKLKDVGNQLPGSKKALADFVESLALLADVSDLDNENLFILSKKLQDLMFASKDATTTQNLLKDAMDGVNRTTKKEADAVEKAKQDKKDLADTVKEHIQALKDENTQLTLGTKALQAQQLSRKGYSAEQIKAIFLLQEGNRVLLESKALREADAEAVRAQAISADDYVNGVVAQADALGKSNIELLLANDLVKGLDTEQKKAFDNAIQRLKDFQAAQEESKKVESAKGKLESLRQSLLTEEQALEESMVNQNLILVENLALGVINEQTFRDMQLQVIEDFNEKKKALLDQGVTDELEGMNFLEKATIEGAKRLESFNKLSATEQTQHVLGELSGQFNGIAKNNKRLFAISKAFNIANAIMNTATAATLAYKSYPPPLNYVMAGGVIAAGMGQVAQIKSQSFEGGGFTGNGARSGGMDGKGGFPAILHPNESVVDHTKGQGGGITIVNNVDASGSGGDVDMKIRSAMQQTSQQTVLAIQDLMKRRRFG
jgi:hypothetical protein